MKKGEGWASATIRFSLPDGSVAEQNIQVSIGGEIVESFLQEAQEVVDGDLLEGRDLMVSFTVSGPMDAAIYHRIVTYSLDRWQGIPWDEVSGFRTSVDRP